MVGILQVEVNKRGREFSYLKGPLVYTKQLDYELEIDFNHV